MNREEVWKNFDLGTEIDIAGTFIYNGLRCFHEMRTLDHAEEIFEFFYNLSVGVERLLKVAVILLEHDGTQDQEVFEKSLITHNHLELLKRINTQASLNLASPHNEFLGMLGTFYRSFRYDRFSLSLAWNPDKEKAAMRDFLEKHLQVSLNDTLSFFATENAPQFKKFIGSLVKKISGELYRVVTERAYSLNLYTYERRVDTKAAKIFLKADFTFEAEDVLWKELLIFFMNTSEQSGLLDYLRSIEPLEFDEALAQEYLQCFQSEEAKQTVLDELEALYEELDSRGARLAALELIGDTGVIFDSEYDETENED